MRLMLSVTAAALLAATAAVAQYNAPATSSPTPSATNNNASAPATTTAPSANAPSNPAVKTTEGNNPGAPAPGANSFTEGQAKARIESRGYANVTELSKDTSGFWRGKAMKDGKAVNVTLDYQGNVTIN